MAWFSPHLLLFEVHRDEGCDENVKQGAVSHGAEDSQKKMAACRVWLSL